MKKGNLTYNELMKLCKKQGEYYVSKVGEEYTKALSEVFKTVNKNDKPFSIQDIQKQPTVNDFNFKGLNEFKFICKLKARPLMLNSSGERIQNEQIIAFDFSSKDAENIFKNSIGVAYMITCTINKKEHIIKFGQSRTAFKQRLGSYNCGTVNNWRTASTTNIKMLQSLVATNIEYKLYLRESGDFKKYITDNNQPFEVFNWSGVESIPFASPFSLAIEDICVKKYKEKYGTPPIANVQANATDVRKNK